MKDFKSPIPYCILAVLLSSGCAASSGVLDFERMSDSDVTHLATERAGILLDTCKVRETACGMKLDFLSGIDSVIVNRDERTITIEFSDAFAQRPFREQAVGIIHELFQGGLGPEFEGFQTELKTLGRPLGQLVPNLYRTRDLDVSRKPEVSDAPRRLTTDLSKAWQSSAQMSGRHVAVWPSHGWYYERSLHRWEWQRARLFQTVEDLFPMSFVVPYLSRMLENAGAYVHIPRERDVQVNEVVVDFDTASEGPNRYLEIGQPSVSWRTARSTGYRHVEKLELENPFREGTYRISSTDTVSSAMVSWIPSIPESGQYAVYVSYGRENDATSDARYTVFHTGGRSTFSVNQTMMGGTWVYLGTFQFGAGSRPETGRVELSNQSSDPGKRLSADAVRFGGGMGSVARGGQTSGRGRYTEGARYYLQYAGMPDTLVYHVSEGTSDYVDDYRSRAEWVNYLRGNPFGPNKNRSVKGLNVPVDLSVAFHTDAGVTKSDDTVGTLMIYSSTGALGDADFPDGMSRFANRDFADIMQTIIVADIRSKYDPQWTRRGIWDKDYSEAVRPNVPAVLLELLSHQNFSDMKFGLDPRFRRDVARSLYKSIAYFLASQHGYDPVIQPLPVSHMRAEWTREGHIQVSWNPVSDPLEPTADPENYVVYVRKNDSGYDSGTLVSASPFLFRSPVPGTVYGFRVGAVNAGGESMKSEEVAAARPPGDGATDEFLIIAAFDRISAPAHVSFGSFQGFAPFLDEGVADYQDMSYVGAQYDFDADSPWLDDDSPGHGASHSTYETRVITGNTFDYGAVHGAAVLAAGLAFSTASDEAVEAGLVPLEGFAFIDLLLGEEKTTIGPGKLTDFEAIPAIMQERLAEAQAQGASLIVSGAHVATDLAGPGSDDAARAFAANVLGFTWRSDHADQSGHVYGTDAFSSTGNLSFNTDPTARVYRVESPDALEAADGSVTLMRYSDNNMSAMIGRSGKGGVIVAGFPFETVEGSLARAALMKEMLNFLK